MGEFDDKNLPSSTKSPETLSILELKLKFFHSDSDLHFMKNYYLLNTNLKFDPSGDDEKTMLTEGIAAAYMSPWKNEIKKLKSGDVVFLYRREYGVIAFGESTATLCARTYKNDPRLKNEEFYKKLKHFQVIEKQPVSAQEINHLTDQKVAFQKTLIKISPKVGEALLAECEKRTRTKLKLAA